MYKITKLDRSTELHESLHWCKYQEKNDIMVSCDADEGEVVLSLDQSAFYNVNFKPVIHENFEMVMVEEMRWYPIVDNLDVQTAESYLDHEFRISNIELGL